MKLEAQVGDATATIQIERKAGVFRATIEDRVIEGDVLEPEPGVFSFRIGDRVIEFHAGTIAGSELCRVVTVTGTTDVRIIDRKHRSAIDDSTGVGQQTLLAPMPGRIVALLAAVGDRVERGQGVLVVEAMKMQNEVKAAREGVVTEIRVAAGDTVSSGQILALLEQPEE